MSCDKLVFDLSQEIEGSPNVFVKKDWLNILDNQNQNYSSNQSVIDTSQLSNSNKYMSYREAYLMMPLLLTVSTAAGQFTPATAGASSDYCVGLKNWFGTMIHSFTVDYMGTTIIQQTPFGNMWNNFKLMTSLSWNDVITQGSTIGFYPDDPLCFGFIRTGDAPNAFGQGVFNNMDDPCNAVVPIGVADRFNNYNFAQGNIGFAKRQQYINFDLAGAIGIGATYASLIPQQSVNNLWKSYIFNKTNNVAGGIMQIAISATVYLKHIHSFFAMTPLLKGVFLKITANLNNCVVSTNNIGNQGAVASMVLNSVAVPVGGVCPLMIASASAVPVAQGASNLGGLAGGVNAATYIYTLQVGGRTLNAGVANIVGYQPSPLAQSVYLYVPAYTFNPVFEQAYLSSPIKQIKYTDIYQYQVLNVNANATFNNLITNGIANIKSVLILPFYSSSPNPSTSGLPVGLPVYQSPYDPCGGGPTSPLCLITNFNVVISGQNAIYNTERYAFEQFNNQLYGQNAVNGGMTDGLTSSLINHSVLKWNTVTTMSM